jgi:glucose/arabinose dehydrogenase
MRRRVISKGKMKPMRPLALVSLVVAGAALAAPSPGAAAVSLQQIGTFTGTFTDPVYATSLPDPDRLLVVERRGTVQLWEDDASSTFLDIRSLVNAAGEDQGLFSVAVAPDYSSSGHIYVLYTRSDDALQIDEFTASGDSAPLSTRRAVLTIDHSESDTHNGGQLQFGPDGYLYASTGDGDVNGDPEGDAQSLDSLLGKILRIDPRPSGGAQYSVAPGNPFNSPVWALGLRNPWRFSFDAATGDLLIADVGATVREEVDYAPRSAGGGRGLNFGWNCREGTLAFSGCTSPIPFTDPIFQYPHDGGACAIMGGYVVRDPNLPGLYGRYLYGDLCTGRIRSLALPGGTGDRYEGLQVGQLQSFGEDSCGRIYVASAIGPVYRLVGDSPTRCQAVGPPPTAPSPAPPSPPTCSGVVATRLPAANGAVIGTPGRDVILGDTRRNTIRAKGGRDVICAGSGADRIKAGAGRDKIYGGPGNDRCDGGPGKDTERSC